MTVHDITRPTVLLTGPTSGIGAGMLRHLLQHPAQPTLVLLARNEEALAGCVEDARSAGLAAHGIQVDLADLDSVRHALDAVGALIAAGTISPIDSALLNAGTHLADRAQVGPQGYEVTFTVNVIAQHLLVTGLEPLLARDGHVVVMGSSTHRGRKQSFNLMPDPEWRDPAELATADVGAGTSTSAAWERGGVAYASSKLALVTASHVWAERYSASGHRLNTYDPGLTVGTGLVRDMSAFRYWFWKNVMPVLALHPKASTPRITGRHAVELALGEAHPRLHNGYVEIGKVTTAEPITFDKTRQRQLVAWLDAATEEFSAAATAAATESRDRG
jgi:NAD(P)-dependent dehydrogenase (short-subunit alcohol dehydrogenase family)